MVEVVTRQQREQARQSAGLTREQALRLVQRKRRLTTQQALRQEASRAELARRQQATGEISSQETTLRSQEQEFKRISKLPTREEVVAREKARLIADIKQAKKIANKAIPLKFLQGRVREFVRELREGTSSSAVLIEKEAQKLDVTPASAKITGVVRPLPISFSKPSSSVLTTTFAQRLKGVTIQDPVQPKITTSSLGSGSFSSGRLGPQSIGSVSTSGVTVPTVTAISKASPVISRPSTSRAGGFVGRTTSQPSFRRQKKNGKDCIVVNELYDVFGVTRRTLSKKIADDLPRKLALNFGRRAVRSNPNIVSFNIKRDFNARPRKFCGFKVGDLR